MAKIKKEVEQKQPVKKKKKNLSFMDELNQVPRTVQQTIPYQSVYESGIIQIDEDHFSKTYKLTDINFKTAEESEQESIFLEFEALINGLDGVSIGKVTCFNRNIDPDSIKNKILMEPKKDGLNKYRDEFNTVVLDKMKEGKNNIVKEKYYTVIVEAESVENATIQFSYLDTDISSKLRRIVGTEISPMKMDGRLSLLYDIYNDGTFYPFSKKIEGITNNGRLDLKGLNRHGLTTKDLIGPTAISFYRDYFELPDKIGRVLFISKLPTMLTAGDVLDTLTDLPCNMLLSVIFDPIPGDEASKMIKHKITDINENIIRAQQKAQKGGYSGDILPSELTQAKEQIEELRADMQSRNQKLFRVTIVACLLASTKKELDHFTSSFKSAAMTHLCEAQVLNYQQEKGLSTCLPLGGNYLKIKRVLSTEAASAFIPFSVQDISHDDGYYYGVNAVSKNLILYNRLNGDNYNGMIFGKPGSGKSFIAKTEIINTLLKTDDDVYVIDPEGEYSSLASKFKGQVIKISIGAKSHINPLDMDIQFAGEEGEDPIALKCDFLTSLCETILKHGGGSEMNPLMLNVIHKCGREIYRAYWKHVEALSRKTGVTCDREAMPTLVDFYQTLLREGSGQAQLLASALEMYCIGNYDLFAKKTNIDVNSRFIVYDIKDIPSGMKELALQICLNDIWNRIVENKKKNRRTWFYIDEFYLLTQQESSAQFVQQIYKRARKWGGIPTGITQNVDDLLTNEVAGTILNNCNFLLMMNQSQMDRNALARLYDISDPLLEYISDKPAGTGLVYTGSTIIPFINEFPSNNELYRIMSTKATEIKQEESDDEDEEFADFDEF